MRCSSLEIALVDALQTKGLVIVPEELKSGSLVSVLREKLQSK